MTALTSGCTWPTRDHSTLTAIKAESLALMRAHPGMNRPIPQHDWPRAIANLQPTFVSVDEQGVDIMMKPAMDGGYGYYVPKNAREVPDPPERYSKLDEGVYWYRPY